LNDIETGKPTQNGTPGELQPATAGKYLNVAWFENLFDAHRKTAS
jgi:hypothetical protein